eukprot:TRINITY_DN32405_c0_g1_i1.p1 TRINITY_DN32405_c0_g1~~TRINITY_DN32405_c0_g1_i1.p1  ORF type:complete len:441 (+),score=65.69 TRINITY_DN32405_c0_g1_i1:149-1471(+)
MMAHNSIIRTLSCLVLLGSLLLAASEISDSSIMNDARPIILFDTFGFDSTGHINMVLTDVDVLHNPKKPVDPKRMGFFITTALVEMKLQDDLKLGQCVLDDPNIHRLFTLNDALLAQEVSGKFDFKYNVPDAQEYSLFFASCQGHAVVRMNVHQELFNLEANNKADYLPSGKTQLPRLYLVIFLVYALAGAVWVSFCYKMRATVHRIHWLMGGLVFMKALTVLSQAGEYAYIKATGVPHGWNVAYYIFSFFRGVMLFTVIVLIGTGWSFLKPFLQDKEKKVIMIVIPLQVFANVATIVLDESGPSLREWFTWRDIFHLVDIICCCAILFPIVWSIKHLREASHTDGKAARNVVKLTLFRQFYVMVVSYIYFTRIVVYLLKSTTPYHYAWMADLAGEVATLIFYIVTGFLFRPVEHNPYFVLDEEEEEAAVQALKDDDFDL